jgi:hypothetical protein
MTDLQKLDVLKHELSPKLSTARPAIFSDGTVVIHDGTQRARGSYDEVLEIIQASSDAKTMWRRLEAAGLLWPHRPDAD